MSPRRLRRGERVLVAAVVLLVGSLFLRWFDVRLDGLDGGPQPVRGDDATGWTTLGPPWVVFVLVAVLAWSVVLVLALRSGAGRSTYGAVVAVVVAVPVTFVVLLLTALRVLVARPSAEDAAGGAGTLSVLGSAERARDVAFDVGVATGAWIGLAALLLGLVGVWLAMADDRTASAESRAAVPPPVLPVPPRG